MHWGFPGRLLGYSPVLLFVAISVIQPFHADGAMDADKEVDAELHAIGVYEGDEKQNGRVNVRVTCIKRPIMLLLIAYKTVEWNVELDQGTRLLKVVLSGYHKQKVIGLPSTVSVISTSYDEGSPQYLYSYKTDLGAKAKQLVGKKPKTYQAEYSAEAFVVDGQSAHIYLEDSRLGSAAWKGRVGDVALLLEKGADVNDPGYQGQAPLKYAAEKGYLEIVNLLLSRGANVNTRDVWLETPLTAAARAGHLAVVEALLAKGADWHARNREDENTAVVLAALRGNQDMVRVLIAHERAARAKRASRPVLVFVERQKDCTLKRFDTASRKVTVLTELKECPDDSFVSDNPGAVLLRFGNELQVIEARNPQSKGRVIPLLKPDKANPKRQFQRAGFLADGRVATAYQSPKPEKNNQAGTATEWELFAYQDGQWSCIERRSCFTSSWCLHTLFRGRHWQELGDEDQVWHPYLSLNPLVTALGPAEQKAPDQFVRTKDDTYSIHGLRYVQFSINGRERILYHDSSNNLKYGGEESRLQTESLYLQAVPKQDAWMISGAADAAIEGQYLLLSQGTEIGPRLIDLETGQEPIKGLKFPSWVDWPDEH
jgi:hypothetical protein